MGKKLLIKNGLGKQTGGRKAGSVPWREECVQVLEDAMIERKTPKEGPGKNGGIPARFGGMTTRITPVFLWGSIDE